MQLRRTLAILLAVTLLFTLTTVSQAVYLDTKTHIAREAIAEWSEYGIILGYDGYFRPDDSITRAEMALILDRLVSYQTIAENHFRDLDDSWYTEAVLKVNAAGVILGYDGKVRPFDQITRAEAVVMLARAFQIEADADGTHFFEDADEIPVWAAGEVGAMAKAEALPFDREFRQEQAITRAEVIQILDALIAEVYQEAGVYTEPVSGNILILSDNVIFADNMIFGNIYVAGNGNVQFSDVTITGHVTALTEGAGISYESGVTVPESPANPDTEETVPAWDLPEPAGNIEAELDLHYDSQETATVIIRAGRSLAQIAELLEEKGICSANAFLSMVETVDFARYYPWLADSYQAENRLFDLEGYLIPGSYELHCASSPALVLKTFLDETEDHYVSYGAQAIAKGKTLDEILTIASIIEKEAGNCTEQDRATVSSIIYNRLEQGVKLQMNVTENYLEDYVLPYVDADQAAYEPYYNSYLCKGLPAGPICSPRAECIEAALNPYDTDYIFFRSDRFGNIYYAVTYEEHLENGRIAENATKYLGYLGSVSIEAEDQPDTAVPTDGRFSGVTILLDPGHGGTETGSYVGSASEKDINLQIALLLREKLQQEGILVQMTRTTDCTVSTTDRVELVNSLLPDLCLSIHCNSYEADASVSGIDTHHQDSTASKNWASLLQSSLIAASGAKDRGIRTSSSMAMLTDSLVPTTMVHLGFLTNEAEHDLLLGEHYPALLAQALADATFTYLTTYLA